METEMIKRLISEAGWYEGRKIDVGYMAEHLKRSGYSAPNKLINELLEEFWDIRIRYAYSDGYETDIFLNIDEAISNTTNQRAENIKIRVKESVVPVGTMIDTYYILWVSYSGKFYISQLELLYYIGDTILSMVDFVFSEGDLDSREIK